jgi:hypothetical protein
MRTAASIIFLLFIQTPSKYKNIQVLNHMPDSEIQRTMNVWSRQLGVNCTGCHIQGDFASDTMKPKKAARDMYRMVQAINEQELFKTAARKVDCYMCHRGAILP